MVLIGPFRSIRFRTLYHHREHTTISVTIIVLFILTLIIFGFAGWLALHVAKSEDSPYGKTPLSKNQWRALAWLLVVIVALVGAILEFKILTSG